MEFSIGSNFPFFRFAIFSNEKKIANERKVIPDPIDDRKILNHPTFPSLGFWITLEPGGYSLRNQAKGMLEVLRLAVCSEFDSRVSVRPSKLWTPNREYLLKTHSLPFLTAGRLWFGFCWTKEEEVWNLTRDRAPAVINSSWKKTATYFSFLGLWETCRELSFDEEIYPRLRLVILIFRWPIKILWPSDET